MGAINTAQYLAQIRSKMDAQQQVVALLESELQKAILGGSDVSLSGLVSRTTTASGSTTVYAGKIMEIYAGAGLDPAIQGTTVGEMWMAAIQAGMADFGPNLNTSDADVDQDALRQLLYQARALLGELRIEEQAWNGEVNTEKTLRKEVNDFAKL